VVADHMIYGIAIFSPLRGPLSHWTALGQYGVFLFFLVSGYIVPASLERKGDVRAFWVSRAFRLYPVYLLASVALLVLSWAGLGTLSGGGQHPLSAALGHLLMLSGVLDSANAPFTVWTLAYEMVFYLLVTALFLSGVQRRSGLWAVTFAVAAVILGGVLPTTAFTSAFGRRVTDAAADALILGGLALALGSRRRSGKLVGATAAALTAVALAGFNGYSSTMPWQALTILALMFTGTMIYRAGCGQAVRWRTAVAVPVIFLLILAALARQHPRESVLHALLVPERTWVTALLLAVLTFLGGLLLRRRRVPVALSWTGLVSYSLYLLHPLLLGVYRHFSWGDTRQPAGVQAAVVTGFLAACLACSALSYRFVEAPAQVLGKKVARRLDRRARPRLLDELQVDDAAQAEHAAVEGERDQRAGLEVAHQEAD